MTLAFNWPKTVISSWHGAFIASFVPIRKQTSLLTATVFPAPLKARNIYRFFKDTFRAMNTEASIAVKGVMLVLLVSFTVGVVEDDGATVGEGRGTTLWLLQSLAWQHWMSNELRSTVSLLKNWSKAVLNCRPVFPVKKKSRRPLLKRILRLFNVFTHWPCIEYVKLIIRNKECEAPLLGNLSK